jgi:hypothetical protein
VREVWVVKIFVKIERDTDPRPGDADPYKYVGKAMLPCCDRVKELWKGTYEFIVTPGVCGGSPHLMCVHKHHSWAIGFDYCIFCGARTEQDSSGNLPEGLAWEPFQ